MGFKLTDEEKQTIVFRALENADYGIRRDLNAYVERAGVEGVVMGVSGGVDSALTMAICADVLGADKVLAIIMPYSDELHAENTQDAIDLCKQYGVRFVVNSIAYPVDSMFDEVITPFLQVDYDLCKGNAMARTRMMYLYHYARMRNMLVAGTSNKPERQTGYFTKYGDGGADIEVIGKLLKNQVWELAKKYGVPQKIIDKKPSANLWVGQTDEDELGFTYDELDYIIHYRESTGTGYLYEPPEILPEENKAALRAIVDRVGMDRFLKFDKILKASEHKRVSIPIMGIWGTFSLNRGR